MNLYILTEGFTYTGYGHITRCMAIAHKFKEYNVKVVFVVNGDENVLKLLHDFQVVSLNWLQCYGNLQSVLKEADAILIDSYLASLDIYEYIHSLVPCSMYLDDYNRLDYPSGIIVNGTIGAEFLPYSSRPDTLFLLGKDYVLLREAFKTVPSKRIISNKIESVLVTFGGTDPLNMTTKVLKVLIEKYPLWKKRIVLGASFSDKDSVFSLADNNTEIYYNIEAEKMKELMLASDIAISAAGQTINELAITGLPSLICKVADNQDNNILGWKNNGFLHNTINALNEWNEEEFIFCLNSLLDKTVRERFSEAGKSAIDAKGVDRLVKSLLLKYVSESLVIRKASEKDVLPLFELANDKLVRKNSFSTNTIKLDEHINWFNSVLINPKRKLFVFYVKNEFVAQTRFDESPEDNIAVISISVVSSYRGFGIASLLLIKSLEQYGLEDIYCKEIQAFIKKENIASQKSFINAGFVFCEEIENNVLKFVYHYGN